MKLILNWPISLHCWKSCKWLDHTSAVSHERNWIRMRAIMALLSKLLYNEKVKPEEIEDALWYGLWSKELGILRAQSGTKESNFKCPYWWRSLGYLMLSMDLRGLQSSTRRRAGALVVRKLLCQLLLYVGCWMKGLGTRLRAIPFSPIFRLLADSYS